MDKLCEIVCTVYGKKEIKKGRVRPNPEMRAIIVTLMQWYSKSTWDQIAGYFMLDHAIVYHAKNYFVPNLYDTDKLFRYQFNDIDEKFQNFLYSTENKEEICDFIEENFAGIIGFDF